MKEQPDLIEEKMPASPFPLFTQWYQDGEQLGLIEPSAMTLATATRDGKPSARIVLLRGFNERGFHFFTNYYSRKGEELAENPHASLVLYWPPNFRQVRIEGTVTKVTEEESEAYFRARPRGHCLGAWASNQSKVIANREMLQEKMDAMEKQFVGKEVPRPPHWGGYRVAPTMIEFWQGRENRLHDRLRYSLQSGGKWKLERIEP